MDRRPDERSDGRGEHERTGRQQHQQRFEPLKRQSTDPGEPAFRLVVGQPPDAVEGMVDLREDGDRRDQQDDKADRTARRGIAAHGLQGASDLAAELGRYLLLDRHEQAFLRILAGNGRLQRDAQAGHQHQQEREQREGEVIGHRRRHQRAVVLVEALIGGEQPAHEAAGILGKNIGIIHGHDCTRDGAGVQQAR